MTHCKQKLQAEIQAEIASRNCKQKLQAEIASKNYKQKLQAQIASTNYKHKLQAQIASKIWIQNKANNEATKPKSKSYLFLLFFWPKPTYDSAFGW